MAYPAAKQSTPKQNVDFSGLLPHYSNLKDGSRVMLRRLDIQSDSKLLVAMLELFNHEVSRGDSYPLDIPLSLEDFTSYFTSFETFVLLALASSDVRVKPPAKSAGCYLTSSAAASAVYLSDPLLVGCFYIKPNWPGRCSHICNGGFLVAPAYRNQGAAFIMGERYRFLAKRLGYRASMFNLVFETNLGSNYLWHRLGFTNAGRVPLAGRLKKHKEDHAAFQKAVQIFRLKVVESKKGFNGVLSADEEEWVNSPLFVEKDTAEVYVTALQWYLDVSQPLKKISPPWVISKSSL